MKNVRTDLAIEAKEIYEQENKSEGKIPGVEVIEKKERGINVTSVEIMNQTGERALGKPIGKYITIEMPNNNQVEGDTVSEVLAQCLSKVFTLESSMTALVVGLGNWNITPDAVGPKVVSKIMVTRHLKQLIPDKIDERIRPVCAVSPGVLGLTGIETSEIVKGVVSKVKPDVVICVDALAARKLERVNSTIQIGNTGISPGSGVGNRRMELSYKTLKIPVIAIGVPTVVDAATMANDTIDMVIEELTKEAKTGSSFYNMLKSMEKEEKQRLLSEVLKPRVGDLIVTPKDVDSVTETLSNVIADGINLSLQPELTLDDIYSYLN